MITSDVEHGPQFRQTELAVYCYDDGTGGEYGVWTNTHCLPLFVENVWKEVCVIQYK